MCSALVLISLVACTAAPGSGADGITVRVLDPDTLEPVSGAEVLFLDHATIKQVGTSRYGERAEADPLDPESWLRKRAKVLRTNRGGEVQLPAFTWRAWVAALHGTRWKLCGISARVPSPYEIVLDEAQHVDVEVVDVQGRPVEGVLVGAGFVPHLMTDLNWDPTLGGFPPVWDQWIAHTNKRGHARLRHVGLNQLDCIPGDHAVIWAGLNTRLNIGCEAGGRISIDLFAPPKSPVRLQAYPAGSLAVTMKYETADLPPLLAGARLTGLGGQWLPARQPDPDVERYVFPRVPTDRPFTIEVSHALQPFRRLNRKSKSLKGGEHREVTVSIPKPEHACARLTMRLVTPAGKPLAGRPLRLFMEEPFIFRIARWTTPSGRFEAWIRPGESGTLVLNSLAEDSDRFSARVPVSKSVKGNVDLGDIVVDITPNEVLREDPRGTLRGRILTESDGLTSVLLVKLSAKDVDNPFRRPFGHGRFEFARVPPQDAHVQVWTAFAKQPIFRTSVSVAAGPPVNVPPIDLRKLLRERTFQIVDEAGKPWSGEYVQIVDEESTQFRGLVQRVTKGELRIPVAKLDADRKAVIKTSDWTSSAISVSDKKVVMRRR